MKKFFSIAQWFILVPFFAMIFSVGCEDANPKQTSVERVQYYVHYYKDNRTGICFAGNGKEHLDCDHSHLTEVQCNDAVERLVEPWPAFNH